MKNLNMLLILPAHWADHDSFRKPWWSVSRIPPVGLMSIAGYLNQEGYSTEIVDCRRLITEHKTNDYVPILLDVIKDRQPDVIGINIITALFDSAKAICDAVKTYFPNTPLIAGAVHPSTEPQLTFEQIQSIDAIGVGAGEETCLDVMKHGKLSNVEGLMVRGQEDEYVKRPPEMNIDKYPFPEYDDYYTQFSTNHIVGWAFRGVLAMTSRSCPYSCKFCASDWSKPVRFHSVEYVIELLKYLSKLPVDCVTICDDTIAINRDRLAQICEGFIRKKIFYPHSPLRWGAGLRADQVDADTLRLMKAAGCYHIGIGTESGSDRSLATINKKTTAKTNRRACGLVKEAELSLATSFMLGIPHETEDDMAQTFQFMKELDCNCRGIGTFRPLPGSSFYTEFLQRPEMLEYLRDWENLGNFSIPPRHAFHSVPEGAFAQICDKAFNLAYANYFVSVHQSTLRRHGGLIEQIARRTPMRVCYGNNYYSTKHRKLRAGILLALERTAVYVYLKLPFRTRWGIKLLVERLTRVKPLQFMLWRYSDSDLRIKEAKQ